MKKKGLIVLLMTAMTAAMLVGCKSDTNTTKESKTTVTLFAAKSLNAVMEELIVAYNEIQPNVKIIGDYENAGALMTRIEEGAACDVFFSDDQKQMDQLQGASLILEETRFNVVNNQVCVVTYNGSNTGVTGISDLAKASSLALADSLVPVGIYTRQAMASSAILPKCEDASAITTTEISEILGGIQINECANVGAVIAAVSEGLNEVGTLYYSDTYGYDDKLIILEKIPNELTGDVFYPVAQIQNKEADRLEEEAALDFIHFLISDEAKTILDKYYFDTNVNN